MLRFVLHKNGLLCLMNVTYAQFKITAAWLCLMKPLFSMVMFDETSVMLFTYAQFMLSQMLSCSLCLD
jgi:hypothetical protein